MKKILSFFFIFNLVYSLPKTLDSEHNTIVQNLSSCNLIKTRTFLINGANFNTTHFDIMSKSTLELDILFDDTSFSDNDSIAGVSYEISCDNKYSGYVDLNFYVNKINIKYSSSQLKLELPDDTNFHNLIFVDTKI